MALRQLRRLPAARFLALVAFFGVCMGATKRVSTGKELVEAFADSNVDVALIVVPALYPSDADFSGFDLPVRVTRDIVLLGSSAAPEDWPLLDLGGITSPKVGHKPMCWCQSCGQAATREGQDTCLRPETPPRAMHACSAMVNPPR